MHKKEIPFVANSEDDLHCLQASYMSIARHFIPDFDVEWDEWSRLTGFEEGKGTWASSALLWFKDNNFEVRHISLFDYGSFARRGGDYLIQLCGEEVGNWQIQHTNMEKETTLADQLISEGLTELREPKIEDIEALLEEGWLVRVLVNSKALNGKEGYFGHSVLVINVEDDSVVIHDPGLPPIPNRRVDKDVFLNAWASPNDESKELDAVRK